MSNYFMKNLVEKLPQEYVSCDKTSCRAQATYRIPFCIGGITLYMPGLYLCEEHTNEYLSLFKDGETSKEV